MNKATLSQMLDSGWSLERIGAAIDRHPSTVAYWVGRHDLTAAHADRHAPKGAPSRARLTELAAAGATLATMAADLDRSTATIRHWLRRWDIDRAPSAESRRRADPRAAPVETTLTCRHHGRTLFRLNNRGWYRCLRCRQQAVADRRRRIKQILVEEAGGECVRCGYARALVALQFHHVDRATKSFALSGEGVTRSLARARAEATKCVLLCANCHAEVESGSPLASPDSL